MKKVFILTMAILFLSAFNLAAQDCVDCIKKEDKPGFSIAPDAFKKKEDKSGDELKKLVDAYNNAPAKNKTAAKNAVTKFVEKQEKERIAQEKLSIKRQKEKLKAWEESLKKQEENQKEIVQRKAENAIAGKEEKTAYDKLIEKQQERSKGMKTKALQKASSAQEKIN
ncbi:Skp family chaperone for outer membrane proteins [Elusimicrobium posterum]|uniref:hypothetical protein n=1 Tax=Elusimicrobium posterum TaxID=3116653 RepID=UPI003C789695